MNLLQVSRFLTALDESIDIHGLQKRFKENPEADQSAVQQAIKDYRATLQGRKKELLKPFGLDDLDNFKDDPETFVKMVGYAMDSFKEKKEQNALYKKVYEDNRCLITMPKGLKGAAAAGSLCKVDGKPVCPWCVCITYPENKKWWEAYDAKTLFFVYSKDGNKITNAHCLLMTASDVVSTVKGKLSINQLENIDNDGHGGEEDIILERLDDLFAETGMSEGFLTSILGTALGGNLKGVEELVGAKTLYDCIYLNDMKELENCIKSKNFDPNAEFNGNYPLQFAARNRRGEMCRLLLKAGADPNLSKSTMYPPLISAVADKNVELTKLLIDAGANVNVTTRSGETALHNAVFQGQVELCKMLIEAGADLNHRNDYGRTPLMNAASFGKEKPCILLLNAGADANICDNSNRSPLHMAAETLPLEICKLFVKCGASNDSVNITTLETVVQQEKVDKCKFLLDLGVPVNRKNGTCYALSIAARRGNYEICKMLLDAGAVFIDEGDRSALFSSIEGENPKLCKLFIDAGADVNTVGQFGWNEYTPLSFAAKRDNIVFCKMLLAAGADVNASNLKPQENTPLINAIQKNNIEMCKLLIDTGADVNAKKVEDDFRILRPTSPLQAAVKGNNIEICKLLLDAGADVKYRDSSLGETIYQSALRNYNTSRELQELLFQAMSKKH